MMIETLLGAYTRMGIIPLHQPIQLIILPSLPSFLPHCIQLMDQLARSLKGAAVFLDLHEYSGGADQVSAEGGSPRPGLLDDVLEAGVVQQQLRQHLSVTIVVAKRVLSFFLKISGERKQTQFLWEIWNTIA